MEVRFLSAAPFKQQRGHSSKVEQLAYTQKTRERYLLSLPFLSLTRPIASVNVTKYIMNLADYRKYSALSPFFETLHDISNAPLSEAFDQGEGLFVPGKICKAWVLPDNRVVNLKGQWHYEWALSNRKLVEGFGVAPEVLDTRADTPIRLACLNCGFVRINYEGRGAHCVIEASYKKFNRKKSDTLFMVVLNNIQWIDRITVSLLDEEGRTVKTGSEDLHRYADEQEKLNKLPIIGESDVVKEFIQLFSGLEA